MLNKIILIGRLTRDPELRYTTNGVAVARLTIAVDRPQFNREREKETDFIDIVVWQKLAETCANNLGKGRLIAVRWTFTHKFVACSRECAVRRPHVVSTRI